jgi:hypothetical protein
MALWAKPSSSARIPAALITEAIGRDPTAVGFDLWVSGEGQDEAC